MSDNEKNNEAEIIIAHNKEEWNRLLFLLRNPEDTSVFWINCDSSRLKKPLHDALHDQFPNVKPYDININEKTASLRELIYTQSEKIPENSIIHVFGLEDATRSIDFIDNLNFQRDSLFRKTPAHIIFWADFATGTLLARRAYDFWSWIVFSFDFITPSELLTERQKDFENEIQLLDETISIKGKDGAERIRHLEQELDKYIGSVNGNPTTEKQMKDTVTIALALAMEYRNEGDFYKGVDLIERIKKFNSNLINYEDAITLNNALGNMWLELGEFDKSEKIIEEVLESRLRKYGAKDREVATLRSNLASVYMYTGKLQEAINLYNQSLDTIRSFSNDDPDITVCLSGLGMIYKDLGEYLKAKDLLTEALEKSIEYFGKDHPKIAVRLSNLGSVYRYLGMFTETKNVLQRALDIDLKNYGSEHVNVAIRYNNLAYISRDLGNKFAAAEYMSKAFEIRKKKLGEDHPKTQSSLTFERT